MTRILPVRATVAFGALALFIGASVVAPIQEAVAASGSSERAQAVPPAGAKPESTPATPKGAPQAAQKAAGAPAAAEGYTYRAEGRRDPFVSLLNRGLDPRQRKAEGVAGLMSADVVLRGVLQNRGTFLAIVQGPDGKRQFIVHPNDRFADGVVKAITADSMLILQEVNDPLSLTKQREIRKTLRSVEEVK